MIESRLEMVRVASDAVWGFFHGTQGWPGHTTEKWSEKGVEIACVQCGAAINASTSAIWSLLKADEHGGTKA